MGFPDFASCQSKMESQGHSEESAKKICGTLQAKVEGKNTEQLSESELKVVNEYMQKFQGDNRPPKGFWDACTSKYRGKVTDENAYCSFLWYHIVEELGADPTSLLTEQPQHLEAFKKTKEFVKQFSETVTLNDEEIFAVGTWNGDKYTHEDLKEIAENFNKLKDEVKPPVKLGHSENQKLLEADDLPAGGWVKSLKVAGDKLLAEISDVPKKIYELIKNRAYKRKSAEIYPEYTGADGRKYGKVLRAIAFLGGATPAISTLGDIHALYKNRIKQEFKVYDLIGKNDIEIRVFYGTPEGAAKGHLTQGHMAEARGRASDSMFRAADMMRELKNQADKEDLLFNYIVPKLKSLEESGIFSSGEVDDLDLYFRQKVFSKREIFKEGIKDLLDKMDVEQIKAILEITSGISDRVNKLNGIKGGEKMKTLGIQVSSEAFGEDFQTKFNEALKTAFGEDVSIKFEGNTDAETIDALKKKIAELEKEIEDYRHQGDEEDMNMMKSKVDTLTKELSDTKVKLTDSEKKAAELTTTKTKLAEAEQKLEEQAVASHSADVKAFIEKAKVDGKILPAHEQLLSVLMKQIDRKAVIKFTEKDKDGKDIQIEKSPLDMVKAFVESLPKAVEFKEISVNTNVIDTFTADGGKVKIGEQEFEVDDVKLATSARKYAEEHKVSYDIALAEVAKANK